MGDWGRGQIRGVGDPDSQIYRETTPHCLSVLFWKGAAWRTPEKGRRGGGRGGRRGRRVGVGGPLVSDRRDDGTRSRPVCVWGGGGEQRVSALLLECEAGEQGSQSLRLLEFHPSWALVRTWKRAEAQETTLSTRVGCKDPAFGRCRTAQLGPRTLEIWRYLFIFLGEGRGKEPLPHWSDPTST